MSHAAVPAASVLGDATIYPQTFRVRWEPTPEGPFAWTAVSRAQLHGEACLLCAAVRPDLVDAGHICTSEGG
jgi:hypothetical protein